MESLSRDAMDLMAAFDSGALIRPDAEALNMVDLALAVSSSAGVTGLPESPGMLEILGEIGEPEHLVFVAIDGLGMNFVDQLPEDSFLRSNVIRELNSPYPSTTSVVFTSIATGLWPAEHGVTSWFTHVEGINDTVTILPYVRTSDGTPLGDLGLTPEAVFPAPTLAQRFVSDTLFMHPQGIVGSVFTRYQSGNAPAAAYERFDLRSGTDRVVERVRRASEPTFTFLYTDILDMAAHKHGSGGYETWDALTYIERTMGDFVSELNGAARVIVTSDHGHLDVPDEGKYFIEPGGPLCEMTICRPAGDARVVYSMLSGAGKRNFRTFSGLSTARGFFC